MIARRIIPCLDIKNGRTVKGTNFINIKDAGDPIELAAKYAKSGADELVFLDISATQEKRKTLVPLIREIGKVIDIPFTVGGGIRDIEMVDELLKNGADKVSINSAAISTPELISQLASNFGAQCVVVAIDANWVDDEWKVFVRGGTMPTEWNILDWASRAEELGAGEILFTSMMRDGTRSGFQLDVLEALSRRISIPIIASGGAGSIDDFKELFSKTRISAGLAASVFHYEEVEILELKRQLAAQNIRVKI